MKNILSIVLTVLLTFSIQKVYTQCSVTISQNPLVPICGSPTLEANFNGVLLPPQPGNKYLICDNNPLNSTEFDAAMDTLFGVGNWTKLTYANADPAIVFSPATQFVYIEGSDSNSVNQDNYLQSYLSIIENWVFNGGRLFLNRAAFSGLGLQNTNFGFGAVTNIFLLNNTGSVVPNHPVGNGLYLPAGNNSISGNFFAHSIITGGNTIPIITNNGQYLLSGKPWGMGYALFGGITACNFHSPYLNAKNIFRNYLHYIANTALAPVVSFNWQPGGMTTASITAPTSGIYTVTATQLGCTTTATYSVYVNPSVHINPVISAGTVVVNASGGTPPYTYNINGGPFVPNNTFSNLCSGNYTLTVKDSYAAACTADTVVSIVGLNNFAGGTVTPFIIHPTCNLAGNGSIALNITPAGTYHYQWSTGDTTSFITNLNAGTYSVTIKNVNNECIDNTYILTAQGNNCGIITGSIFYDSNNDCIKNISEINLENIMITANPGNHITFSDVSGNYYFNGLPFGTYTISHPTNHPNYGAKCGNGFSSTLNLAYPHDTIHFADSIKSSIDFKIQLSTGVCFALANPLKVRKIKYGHNNPLYPVASGTIYAVFDSINHYVSSTPSHSSIHGDTVFWNVSNINYTQSAPFLGSEIVINFEFPVNYTIANTFPFKIGFFDLQYPDTVTINNNFSITISFCNGYDPNNKIVNPKGETNLGYLNYYDQTNDWFTYEINFQNTGNAPAINIRIDDTLSEKLDITTFQMLSASHIYQLEVKDNHILQWTFPNINLPDSISNEPASHGQIQFKIKQKNTNVPGDVITNKVHIYFDYNPPIITNETINTLYMAESTEDYWVEHDGITIYPNPVGNTLHIKSKNTFKHITMYDMQMRKVFYEKIDATLNHAVNVSTLKQGMYFVKIDDGKPFKLIVQK